METVLQEINNLRAEVLATREGLRELCDSLKSRKRKAPSPEEVRCTGVTAKGTPCTNRRLPGDDRCKMHCRDRQLTKKTVTESEKQVSTAVLCHTHSAGSTTRDCPQCESAGNVLDPDLVDCDFLEDDGDLDARLQAMINEVTSTDV
jgi:hypothetical protein